MKIHPTYRVNIKKKSFDHEKNRNLNDAFTFNESDN